MSESPISTVLSHSATELPEKAALRLAQYDQTVLQTLLSENCLSQDLDSKVGCSEWCAVRSLEIEAMPEMGHGIAPR
jgi:hypothetical protein